MAGSPVNRIWIIASTAIVDVSTPKFPRATCLLDLVDLPKIEGAGRWYAWRAAGNQAIYARRHGSDDRIEYMHRALAGRAGMQVDHRDGDGLDNRRKNIREATPRQNARNRGALKGSTSRFTGVWRIKTVAKERWGACIKFDKRTRYLGVFTTEVGAARAYDRAAREHFGEFARPNFKEAA